MTDPKIDSGLIFDIYSDIHITRSPFFDVRFGFDDTVEDYLIRILPTLVDVIDKQFQDYDWTIDGHPSVPSPPRSTFPWIKTIGVATILVASLGVLKIFSR
ncbi:hypothetical protein MA16_Dca020904 [Dendrobium catenatum]|uniref:Uncharacterized protein n=1 Tax=Dendrobium catenatum TaxID=906689 RepID=A0A2I0VN32_9ASPA|nr:hypothetical protein MA16_Dca020904 [Dendrobium catenatum]